jgi:hypothetical protein
MYDWLESAQVWLSEKLKGGNIFNDRKNGESDYFVKLFFFLENLTIL